MYTNRDTAPLAFHHFFWYFLLPVAFISRLYSFIKLIGAMDEYSEARSALSYVDSGLMSKLDGYIVFCLIYLGILLILGAVAFIGFFGWKKYAYNATCTILIIGLVVYVILSILSIYWLIEVIDITNDPSKAYGLLSGDKNLLLVGLGVMALVAREASELGIDFDDPVTVAIVILAFNFLVMSLYSAMYRYYSRRKALFSDSYTAPAPAGYAAPVSRAPVSYPSSGYPAAGAASGAYSAPSAYGTGTGYGAPRPSGSGLRSTMPTAPSTPAAPSYPSASAPASAPRSMQFCTVCGAVVNPGSGFCNACGAPVRSMATPVPAPRTAPPSTSAALPTDAAAVPSASGITRRPAPTNRDNSGFMSAGDL